jgi:hypothetical protein
VRDVSQISDRLSDCGRVGGVFVGVDDPQLGVTFGQSFADEVSFADQLRSELNPLGEKRPLRGSGGISVRRSSLTTG